MNASDHIGRFVSEAIRIALDVRVEHRFRIDPFCAHTLEHGNGAKVRQQWVVELYIAATGLIKIVQFFAVSLG